MDARRLSLSLAAAVAGLLATRAVGADLVFHVTPASVTEGTVQESQDARPPLHDPPVFSRPVGAADEKAGYGECFGEGCPDICCPPEGHGIHVGFFAEFLYLCPRNEGVEYAVPANGPLTAGAVAVQEGPTAVVQPEFSAGFRVGFDVAVNDCGSFFAACTNYSSSASDSISTNAPLVLIPMVMNPSSLNAGAVWLSAAANERTTFDLVDLGYRYNLWSCDQKSVGLLAGLRYGHLGQQFHVDYSDIITETVESGVNFDCLGARVGVDGDWCLGRGFFIHGTAAASLVGGEFNASYLNVQAAAPSTPIATTTWHEARFASILDGELAIGWQSCNGRIRLMGGYSITDWCNVVKPSDFIAGVQANNYRSANQVAQTALIFDGLVTRAEVRW